MRTLSSSRRARVSDVAAHLATLCAALAVLAIASLLVANLWQGSTLARQKFGWGFLTSGSWDPVAGRFGALPFVYGTLVSSLVALGIALPAGLGAAIFLSELAPTRISRGLTLVVELLAAVPSVIYGLVALATLVPALREGIQPFLQNHLGFLPFFRGPMYGVGMLAAGLVLGIMILPFIVSLSREALLAVPAEQREGALALGATRWETTWQVVVPYARLGILGSVFISLARALGETMAVTMVIGNDPKIAASLFESGYSIAAVIANEFSEATSDLHISALVELGMVLFALTIAINAAARVLIRATDKRGATVA